MSAVDAVDAVGPLKKSQGKWRDQNLKANKEAVGEMEAAEKEEVKRYLQTRIDAMGSEIVELQKELPSTKVLLPDVMEENGTCVSAEDLKRDPGRFHLLKSLPDLIQVELFRPPISEPTKDEPSLGPRQELGRR